MRDPKQKMRYTFAELGLIKSLFADNDQLLYLIRKVLFQFELTKEEEDHLNKSMTEQVYALLVKTILPYVDIEAPIHQMAHLNTGLGADIKTLSPEGAWPFIRAKKLETEYLKQQLACLHGKVERKIVLEELTDLEFAGTAKGKEDAWVNVTAWNFLMSFIDGSIQQLKFLAGLKHETVEQTLARLAQNSSK